MRADLHLHSYHSGYAGHLPFLRARDCYSEPADVYAVAKARGMDLVTITDHDSIGGCLEFLDRHPGAADFFISEEIECYFPDHALKVHIGAYGIDERIHREIQPLRRNVYEAAACLRSERVAYALNHPFFFYRGQMDLDRYLTAIANLFPAWEVRNGTMLEVHNQLVAQLGEVYAPFARMTHFGGSDSHTLHGVGTTYTEAPGTSVSEFLDSLRAGRASVGGCHGSAWREAREIYGVVVQYWATLLGAGRHDLSWSRRILGLAFSLVSMPFEFTPLLVALRDKLSEAGRVRRYREELRRLSASSRACAASL